MDADSSLSSAAESTGLTIRVAVVVAEPILRLGLRATLEQEPDFEVVDEHADLLHARRALGAQPVDVLVVIYQPEAGAGRSRDGFQAVARLRREFTDLRVLVLDEIVDESGALAALRAGAWGYLGVTSTPQALVTAIREMHGGNVALPRALARRLALLLSSEAAAS